MSIITKINGIPLFRDEQRAKLWGAHYGLVGSHTHNHNGTIGYMAGINHDQSINGIIKSGKAPAEVIREYNKRNQQVGISRTAVAQSTTILPQPTQQQVTRTPAQQMPQAPRVPTVPSGGGTSGGGY